MCVAATAKRRRRQAVMGFKHIARLGRPIYRAADAETRKRKAEQKLREMQARIARGGKA